MKKIIIFFIIFLISGCAKETTPTQNPNQNNLKKLMANLDCHLIKKSKTRNECYIELVKKDHSTEQCDKIVGDKMSLGDCYNTVAQITKDINICNKIQTNSIKYACLAEMNKNDLACNKLQDENKNICLISSAKSLGQESICEKLEKQTTKESCYEKTAASAQNESLCDKIEDRNTKDICYLRVAKSKEDETLCNQIENTNNINSCLLNTAIAKNDTNLCYEMKDTNKKNNCLSEIAINLFDIEICSQIQNEKNKIECKKIINNQ